MSDLVTPPPDNAQAAAQAAARQLANRPVRVRLLDKVRRLSERGQAMYILAILLLSLGMITARHTIISMIDHYDALKAEVGDILRGRHESRRDDSYFGVLAALLGGVNADLPDGGHDLCPAESVECMKGRNLADLFVRIAEASLPVVDSSGDTSSDIERVLHVAKQWIAVPAEERSDFDR